MTGIPVGISRMAASSAVAGRTRQRSTIGLLRNHLLPTFGGAITLNEITLASIRRWRKERLDAGPGAARPFGPVTFPAEIIPELREHLRRYASPSPKGLVFVGPKGGILRRNNFNPIWRRACVTAGDQGTHGPARSLQPARRDDLLARHPRTRQDHSRWPRSAPTRCPCPEGSPGMIWLVDGPTASFWASNALENYYPPARAGDGNRKRMTSLERSVLRPGG
jgi:hypothetical protein